MGQMDDIAAIRAMLEAMQRKLDAVVMQPRPEWVTVHEYAEHHGNHGDQAVKVARTI